MDYPMTSVLLILFGAVSLCFIIYYAFKLGSVIGIKKASAVGPMFINCAQCGAHMYPTEPVCTTCGYAWVTEVRGWVYRDWTCKRVFTSRIGGASPFSASVEPDEHPLATLTRVVNKGLRLNLSDTRFTPVAVIEDNKKVIMYAVAVLVQPDEGPHIRPSVTTMTVLPNNLDQSVFYLVSQCAMKYMNRPDRPTWVVQTGFEFPVKGEDNAC